MLIGVAGLSIPIILHILNRLRSKKVQWGAMKFILDCLMLRRRNILLEEVLLLVSRCMSVALLALALARPFVTPQSQVPWIIVLPCGLLALVSFCASFAFWDYPGWRKRLHWASLFLALITVGCVILERWMMINKFGGTQARDVALVVDGSSSMLMEVDGRPNFERAVEEARKLVEDAPGGVRFSLIIAGGAPNPLMPTPTNEKGYLLKSLDEARPMHGTMRAAETLAFASTTLALGTNPNKQIIIIGDGQAEGWDLNQDSKWSVLGKVFEKLKAKPQIIWRRLPVPSNIRNLTLSRIDFSRDIIGTDRKVRIDITVENTGVEGVTPQNVSLKVEDKTYTDATLNQIEPGAFHTVSFWHQFTKPGTHAVTAHVDAMDGLPADDRATRVAHVIGSLRVLVVEGAAGNLMQRSSGFLSLSLMPDFMALATGGRSERFLVSPEIITVGEFVSRERYDGVAVVVLADVPSLPSKSAEALASFVANGGGFMAIHGPSCDPAFYNAWIHPAHGRVVPLQLGELSFAQGTNLVSVATQNVGMEALQTLALGSDLGNVALNRWWGTVGDDAGRSVLRLSNGDALVAEQTFGDGNVIQLMTGLDMTSGNFGVRHSFLPLMHELVYHLARPYSVNLNVAPALGLTLTLAGRGVDSAAVGEGGLRAQYFADKKFKRPMLMRIDPTIDFDWGHGSPGPGIPADHFCVRWTGSLQVPETADWAFHLRVDDRMRVTIGPHKFEGYGVHAKRLEADVKYPVVVEYEEDTGVASAQLYWVGPGFPSPVPIPARCFTPAQAGPEELSGERFEAWATAPNEDRLPVWFIQGKDGIVLRVDDSVVPGVYTVNIPPQLQSAVGHFGDPVKKNLLFNVLPNPRESILTPLDDAELGFFRRYIELMPAASLQDMKSAVKGNAFGKELWRTLAIAMFLILISEIALTRWIAIRRKLGEEGRVLFDETKKPSTSFRDHVARMTGMSGGGQ